MQSTDDAATFTRVAAPSLAAPIGGSEGDFGVNDFVFANRDDGYFYVLNPNPHLYWTGDGGRSWRAVQPGKSSVWRDSGTSGPLASSIVTTHGRAYVLIFRFRSTGGYPTSYALASSAVTDDSWTTVPLPVPGPSTDNVGMAAFGSKVWLIVVPGGGGNASILVSEDEGRSYSPLPTTGMLGLSCRATATASTTLWGSLRNGHEWIRRTFKRWRTGMGGCDGRPFLELRQHSCHLGHRGHLREPILTRRVADTRRRSTFHSGAAVPGSARRLRRSIRQHHHLAGTRDRPEWRQQRAVAHHERRALVAAGEVAEPLGIDDPGSQVRHDVDGGVGAVSRCVHEFDLGTCNGTILDRCWRHHNRDDTQPAITRR